MTFNDFVHDCKLKNKATSNIKFYQVLSSLSLNDVEIYLRDGTFISDIGILYLHPSNGTHWVLYIIEKYFDSYGCSLPQNLFKNIIKRNGHCLYSEYKIQGLKNKKDSFWQVIVYLYSFIHQMFIFSIIAFNFHSTACILCLK